MYFIPTNYMDIIIPLAIMMSLDAIYLMATKTFFNKQIRLVQGSDIKIKIIPALLIYGILAVGLYYFILKNKRPVSDAIL